MCNISAETPPEVRSRFWGVCQHQGGTKFTSLLDLSNHKRINVVYADTRPKNRHMQPVLWIQILHDEGKNQADTVSIVLPSPPQPGQNHPSLV